MSSPTPSSNRRAFTVKEFGAAYGIGRSRTYEEIATGRLEARKAGGRTLIAADSAERWWASLPRLSSKAGTA